MARANPLGWQKTAKSLIQRPDWEIAPPKYCAFYHFVVRTTKMAQPNAASDRWNILPDAKVKSFASGELRKAAGWLTLSSRASRVDGFNAEVWRKAFSHRKGIYRQL